MAIKGVIFQENACDFHEDARRALMSSFNSDIGDFVDRQAKILIPKVKSVLGGHWHPYRELFAMGSVPGKQGYAEFILEDINTREREVYTLATRSRILIPSSVAHLVLINEGSVLMGHTEEPYSKERHDNRYDFANLPQSFLDLMPRPSPKA